MIAVFPVLVSPSRTILYVFFPMVELVIDIFGENNIFFLFYIMSEMYKLAKILSCYK